MVNDITDGPLRHLLLPALLAAWLFAPAAAAETRALVVGIDAYQHISPLHGAVADAQDIAAALRRAGVSDLTLRLDADATRERLTADWQALMDRAQPGDRLVFSFAGHGTQEPERIAGNEDDGKDEVLLLGGVSENGAGTRERIPDDELNQWFRDAAARGLDVLFVADSCHSGTLTRDIDPRAGQGSARYTAYSVSDDLLELDMPPAPSERDAGDLPGLTFLAAGQEHEQVPEVDLFDVDGRRARRGALSWAFARALEGAADRDSDGQLTREELNRFVRANVRAIADSRQTPNLLPVAADTRVVVPLAGASARSGPGSTALPQARLRIEGTDAASAAALLRDLSGTVPAAGPDAVDLVFDIRRREAVSGRGDILARDLDPTRPALQSVIDAWRGVERLKLERLGDRLSMRVFPDDGLHHRGRTIAFEIDDILLPYLVFFSLSGDGTVHFHYPFPGDPPTLPAGRPVRVEFQVTPPFGADHIIAVASDASLDQLAADLKAIDGRRAARQAIEAVLAITRQGRRQLGLQGLYTAP
ncbi:hypothetical protein F2Q65_13550 [Thiohalocapsa marina]|uniref:EF-hand domain-containing protein n=1 Tax=Thiohalocapsa marina TaxID=424902 RepID=A0A5M8FRR3_9GAMM|nr:caspase family protein [Thiohalocapsa marina]KAA6184092.1 hypothetical protein F2Q65_13550 [Thiohalocapsa marina]